MTPWSQNAHGESGSKTLQVSGCSETDNLITSFYGWTHPYVYVSWGKYFKWKKWGFTKSTILTPWCHSHRGVRIFKLHARITWRNRNRNKDQTVSNHENPHNYNEYVMSTEEYNIVLKTAGTVSKPVSREQKSRLPTPSTFFKLNFFYCQTQTVW